MLDRFVEGTWVAPQLAVALGIMHGDEIAPRFQRIIAEVNLADFPAELKKIFSVYAVLQKLGLSEPGGFGASDLVHKLEAGGIEKNVIKNHEDIVSRTVEQWWVFWRPTRKS